jgi:tRNA pseudouridine32 synthase/23S rRNA pseudouridine746 synthase
LTPDEILARVLHRDGLMLVIDKPAGLPVHRGPKGGANLESSFDALRYGLPRPPVLAHRLDRDTSGCLVLGRHRKATATLGLLFKHGKISKTYWAVVEGGPVEDHGTIDLPIGRLNAERGWWQKIDPEGLPSVTNWTVLGRFTPKGAPSAEALPDDAVVASATHDELVASASPPPCEEGSGVGVPAISASVADPHPSPPHKGEGALSARSMAVGNSEQSNAPETTGQLTWLALEPITGRTHQLRVHCAAMGWPIFGDNIYGNGPRFGEPKLHLHARQIVIPLSRNKPPVVVTAPAPAHLHERLKMCGWNGE